MSDHISGPRALADPIADITDVYAFPSPERPGRLVLVMNTLPFAKPDAFSDGLIYRFRLRPLAAARHGDAAPFDGGRRGARLRLRLLSRRHRNGRGAEQEGTCTTPAGETVRSASTTSTAARGAASASSPGALGSVHHGRPRGIEDDRHGQAGVHRPGAIYLDGKNVLSLVVEIDTRAPGRRRPGRRRRRDAHPRQVQRPDRARRAPRGQEHDAGAEAVRPGQPRPGDPRPLQHGGRVPPRATATRAPTAPG